MALTAWQEQQQFNAQREMLIAQGASVGRSTHKVFTKGRGDLRIAQPVNFALTFAEEPVFTTGLVLGPPRLVEHLYPNATVGVYHWQRDSRGMYTGAYVWASIAAGVNREFAGYSYRLETLQDMVRGARPLEGSIEGAQDEIARLQRGTAVYAEATYQLYQTKAELQANAYVLEHHLVFEGLAIRDINYDDMMAD